MQRLEADAMPLHSFVRPEDEIYFFYEYTSGGVGFRFSPGNDLISNLKRDVVKYGNKPQVMGYKNRAIAECGVLLSHGFNPEWLEHAALVPVPPSKAPGDVGYDDRMLRVAQAVRIGRNANHQAVVREIVRQTASLPKSHEADPGDRPGIQALINAYEINEAACQPAVPQFAILDDVLTTGRHFRAMSHVLGERFPKAQIIGVFISRRVVPEGRNPEDVFDIG
jgi:hypothetical protein